MISMKQLLGLFQSAYFGAFRTFNCNGLLFIRIDRVQTAVLPNFQPGPVNGLRVCFILHENNIITKNGYNVNIEANM